MFYPSEQGNNDNAPRAPPQQHLFDSYGFMEGWPQNLSQTDLDEGKRQAAPLYVKRRITETDVITASNIRLTNDAIIAYSQATGDETRLAQAPNNYEDANLGRRSSATTAPHLELQNSLATQDFTPPNLGESQDPVETTSCDPA